MTIQRFHRAIALALVAAVLVFNAGVPVTMYLCPMMSDENPTCDMSVPSFGDIPSITKQASACCAKIIIAERNSTPYLKLEDRLEGSPLLTALPTDAPDDLLEGHDAPLVPDDTGPPIPPLALYILHSTLLI